MSGGTSAATATAATAASASAAAASTAAAAGTAAAATAAASAGAIGAGAGAIFDTALAASAASSTLATVGTVGSILSSGIGALGAIKSGQASSAAAKYNAQVAAQNAQLATQQATWAGAAGEAQVGQQSAKTRADVGAIMAAQAANNISVNQGSAVDVRSSASSLGELSAINIRSTATRQAYGLETQATSETGKSQLDTYQAEQDQLAGEVGGGSTLIGGASSAAYNYNKFLATNSPLSTIIS